jgi:Ca2+/Na+ antiporter
MAEVQHGCFELPRCSEVVLLVLLLSMLVVGCWLLVVACTVCMCFFAFLLCTVGLTNSETGEERETPIESQHNLPRTFLTRVYVSDSFIFVCLRLTYLVCATIGPRFGRAISWMVSSSFSAQTWLFVFFGFCLVISKDSHISTNQELTSTDRSLPHVTCPSYCRNLIKECVGIKIGQEC